MKTTIQLALFDSGDTYISIAVDGQPAGTIVGHTEPLTGFRIDASKVGADALERLSRVFQDIGEALLDEEPSDRPRESGGRRMMSSTTGPDGSTGVGF